MIVHAKISVVRCTFVPILQRTVMIATGNKQKDHRFSFLFLCLCAISHVHIATENVTTAWSEGNEVDGRKLWRIVSSKSCIHNSYIGLFLSKNCCERIFAATEKKQEIKIKIASFFCSISPFIIQ